MAELPAPDPILVGVVAPVFADGKAIVTLPRGGRMWVRHPMGWGAYLLQRGAITGAAPSIDMVVVFI